MSIDARPPPPARSIAEIDRLHPLVGLHDWGRVDPDDGLCVGLIPVDLAAAGMASRRVALKGIDCLELYRGDLTLVGTRRRLQIDMWHSRDWARSGDERSSVDAVLSVSTGPRPPRRSLRPRSRNRTGSDA